MSEIIHRTFKKPIQWEAIKTYELSDEMAVFMALIKLVMLKGALIVRSNYVLFQA